MTASGCGVMVKEYGELLKQDPAYVDKARRIAELTKDISEILAQEDLSVLTLEKRETRVAFHAPCTLQHGQKISGVVEKILESVGYQLTQVHDSHLCCGSAGTYSILQPELSRQLLDDKLHWLNQGKPDLIATANIGCQLHISTRADVPVRHWVELLV